MIFFQHRINDIKTLRKIPIKYGIEVDIRSFNEKLILNHEPFEEGIELENWLTEFKHKYLILNIKEEGLEKRCKEIMNKFKIDKYFFLDQSMPMLIKTVLEGNQKTAIRLSTFESLDTVIKFKNLLEWVWVDFYQKYPLNEEIINILKNNNFKICLVSPELQGKSMYEIKKAQLSISSIKNNIDGICTKYIDTWESFLEEK